MSQLKRFLACSVLAILGQASAADLPLSSAFKFGSGPQMGGLRQTSDRAFTMFAIAELEYKLSEGHSIVGEFGWRYMPGMERVASTFQEQNVNVATTHPAYKKYGSGEVVRAETYNILSSGWQFGALYRKSLPFDLYGQAGVRVNFIKTRHDIMGAEIKFGQAPPAANRETPIESITSLNGSYDRTTTAPSLVLGIGYKFLQRHALEVNVGTATVDSSRFGKKSGALVDFAYRMAF